MLRIITDTACDITRGQAIELDIDIVPLDVHFEETPYHQLEDETFEKFYTLLENCRSLPKTSQPPPERYLRLYRAASLAGDEVLVIALSSALSGTYQSASIAKEISGYDKIHVLDCRNAVMGQRLLVEYAVKLREEGRDVSEIYAILADAVGRVRLFAALDTLKYLRKGGRIPKSTELVGAMLNIKPIVTIDREGAIELAGKARGHAGSVVSLVKLIENNACFDPAMPVYFGYSREEMPCKNFQALASAHFGIAEAVRYPVGPIVGTHIGPGGIAVAYLEK